MSLYDLMRAGVSISNLDATEDNVAAVADETPAEETKVEETTEVETVAEETPAGEVTEEVVETTVTPEGEEVVDTSELETELLEASGDAEEAAEEQAKVDSIEEQIDEAEEAAIATESLIHNLIYTKEVGGGITPAHAELVHEHVQYIGKQLGWGKRDIPNLEYSTESFSTVGALSLTQESILQAAKNMLTKIIQSIIEGVNWVIQQGVNIWNKLFSSFEKMGDTARKLLDYANTKSGSTTLKEGHTMITTPAVKAVHGEKADQGLLPAIGELRETTKELVNNWLPMKIHAQVEELIDGLNTNLNGGIVKAAETIGDGVQHVVDNGVVQSAKDAAQNSFNKAKGAINDTVDKVKNFNVKDIDIKAIAEGIKSGSLNFVKDAVTAIADFATSSTPFIDRDLDKEKMRLYGVDVRPTEAAKGSKVLPGNRAIVLIYPNPNEFGKAYSSVSFLNIGTIAGALMSDNKVKGFLGAYKAQAKEAIGGIPRLEYKMVKLDIKHDSKMEIKVPKMNELIAAAEGLIELCDDCAKLKKHLDSTASFYKKIQRKLAIAKNGLAVKAKFTGSAIQKVLSAVLKWVRSALGILREPGASFCSYMVGEISQLGSVIRAGIDSYEA